MSDGAVEPGGGGGRTQGHQEVHETHAQQVRATLHMYVCMHVLYRYTLIGTHIHMNDSVDKYTHINIVYTYMHKYIHTNINTYHTYTYIHTIHTYHTYCAYVSLRIPWHEAGNNSDEFESGQGDAVEGEEDSDEDDEPVHARKESDHMYVCMHVCM